MVTAFRQDPSRRSDSLQPRQGHVFWFRAGATWLNRDKPRPFALATPHRGSAPATLVYGSTQRTERNAGATNIEVAPIREGLNRNGLYATTLFYPGILLLIGAGALPVASGFLGRSMVDLRAAVRTALGIGQGSCLNPASPVGSRRGRIVVLSPPVARQLRSPVAVILTEPVYSRERRYQLIVPVLSGIRRHANEYDVPIACADWKSLLNQPVEMESAFVPAAVVLSIWHGQSIARETEYVVDDETLREIDRRLCDYFSLTPPNPHDGG